MWRVEKQRKTAKDGKDDVMDNVDTHQSRNLHDEAVSEMQRWESGQLVLELMKPR